MLNFSEWKEKKGDKLSGLSDKQKKKRFDDYVLSTAVAGGASRKQKLRKRAQTGQNMSKKGKMQMSMGSLSQCSRDYAQALINPWDVEIPPCIPDLIVLPSYKFGVRARGTFQIGTAGIGFVCLNPYAVGVDAFPAPIRSGYYTTSAYTLNTFDIGAAAGVLPFNTDTQFKSGDIGQKGIQYRVVGAGIKARYTGVEINRGGRCLSVRHPNNQAIPAWTAQELLAWKETVTNPADREFHFVQFRPANQYDVSYRDIVIAGNSLLLFVEGSVAGVSYEYDVVVWYEVTGTPLPNLTPSHADPLGVAAIHAALPAHQPTETPKKAEKTFMEEVKEVASTAFSFISPIASTALNAIGGPEKLLPLAMSFL